MSTRVRPEISKNNSNYISKHRYYELKHFCLQYKEWKEEYNRLRYSIRDEFDPTCNIGIRMSELSRNMNLVKSCAMEVDAVLGNYIFKAATEDRSYVWLRGYLNMPCSKGVYYNLYRCFWRKLSDKKDS